ncbi:MAG: type II toxin-antitoxin system HicA family toxin [bacterium]
MRIPRDWSGMRLAKALGRFGYRITRQSGSHVRLLTDQKGEHSITIPLHDYLRVGTFSAILSDVGKHLELNREELLNQLLD